VSQPARHPDLAVLRLDHPLRDREAEPAALDGGVDCDPRPVEATEDAVDVGRVDAHAGVRHADVDRVVVVAAADGDRDVAAVRREPERGGEVRHDVLDAGNPCHLGDEPVELVDHGVDGVLQLQHWTLHEESCCRSRVERHPLLTV